MTLSGEIILMQGQFLIFIDHLQNNKLVVWYSSNWLRVDTGNCHKCFLVEIILIQIATLDVYAYTTSLPAPCKASLTIPMMVPGHISGSMAIC